MTSVLEIAQTIALVMLLALHVDMRSEMRANATRILRKLHDKD